MNESSSLQGKTALITGASRGIGAEIACQFARRGANVIICARSADGISQTGNRCRKEGVQVLEQAIDLGQRGEVEKLFGFISAETMEIDFVINNAAIMIKAEMADYSLDDFEKMLRVNVTAALEVSQFAVPYLIESRGTIVNISSLSGCFGVPKFRGFGAYNISKYALWGLTEILALELAEHGIRVNQISFAGVDTEMFRSAIGKKTEAPLKIEDAARHVVCLASPDSAPLTGENIILAGEPLSR